MGKRNLSQNIKTGKEYRNNDNTNELKNKQTNQKNTHTYWQIYKIDIQQYGKIRWSLLWKETSVFLMIVILNRLSLKLMFNRAG